MVTFVTTGELSAANVRLYGGVPPLMVSPQGWQVLRVSVTLAVTVNAGSVDAAGMHCVVCPAMLSGYSKHLRAKDGYSPTTVNRSGGTPPELPCESTTYNKS
jgi:hypothetical protein